MIYVQDLCCRWIILRNTKVFLIEVKSEAFKWMAVAVHVNRYPSWFNQEKLSLSAAGMEAVVGPSALPGGSNVTGGAVAKAGR